MKSLALAILLAASLSAVASAHPVDLGLKADATPYERFMGPVKHVLGELDGRESDFDRVRRLLKVGRSFRYSFTEPYLAASPERTAALRAGDCKAKSLWLISQLNDSTVRYVIGKARLSSPISHAWVMWNDGRRWWILDPTNKREPIAADRVPKDEYVALYSYGTDGAHLHNRASAMMAANAVADRREAVADDTSRAKGWGRFFASR